MKKLLAIIMVISLIAVTGCEVLEKAASGTDIHKAAFEGNLEVIRQLIKDGSNLNAKDRFGSTPLLIAVTFGKTDVALALIGAGADLNITNNEGSTPLITAAFFCRTEIVQSLLDKGADKNVRNKAGSTALDSVVAPYEKVKPYYDNIVKALGPLGLKLDYDYIEVTRPIIAEMLTVSNVK